MESNSIQCNICMHHCNLHEGQTGRCRARRNSNGVSTAINYGRITSIALDPIEKKPLACFRPGSKILSVGSFGCNLSCPFCQNASIAAAGETDTETFRVTPKGLADKALELKSKGNIGVAYTYNEPLVGYEFMIDTAKLVHEHGMVNVVVTNGSANIDAVRDIFPLIDAYNIDLKGFTQRYYDLLGGSLQMVKDFILEAVKWSHVEVTTLIVPQENDSEDEMENLSSWLSTIGRDIPLHITRFFPRYHMQDREATDVKLMVRLQEVARRHLSKVYLGNV